MDFTKDIKFNISPTANNDLTITYNGFLSESSELWLVSGFGDSWENTSEIQMQKTENGFCVTINLIDSDTFNFCFRNSNGQWDNNSTCNYITPIKSITIAEPIVEVQNPEVSTSFDIDALIEEILQPITAEITEPSASLNIESTPIDLGVEVTKILSEINYAENSAETVDCSSLEEILLGSTVEEINIEEFENIQDDNFNDDLINEILENTKKKADILENILSSTQNFANESAISNEEYEYYSIINNEVKEIINKIEQETELESEFEPKLESTSNNEHSLIELPDPFTISPRQLSKFYLFKKRIKLALYKALIKIPKLIFGTNEN